VLAQASTTAQVGRLDEAAERLVIALLEQQLSGPANRVARVAAASAGSLAALKVWLAGDARYREHLYGEAVTAFEEAERLDPGFALAYYRHASAADLLGDARQADSAAARAVRHARRLPEAERTLLLAWRDARMGAVERAEERYEALTDDVPDHAEAWFRLGELQFHANPTRGRSVTDARAAFERAIAIDPHNGEALMYLARIAALQGRLADADALVTRARQASTDPRVMELRAARTFAIGERLLQGRAVRTLQRAGSGDAAGAVGMVVYRDDVDGTLAFARALRAAGASRELRSLAFRLEALGAAARGQALGAHLALDSLATLDGLAALRLRAMLATHPLLASTAASDRRELARRLLPDRDAADADTTRSGLALRRYWRGLLASADRDGDALAHEANALTALASLTPHDPPARALAVSLAARHALLAGRPGEALHLLESARVDAQPDSVGALATVDAGDRFLRAEVLHRLGRDSEAVGWYASIAERATSELPWLAPAQLHLGELAGARGDGPTAVRHYQRFLQLWAHCDPALQPIVTTVRARVVELERAGAPVRASSAPGSRAARP
jgi:tetratricopeptide (TPR) repeat protein